MSGTLNPTSFVIEPKKQGVEKNICREIYAPRKHPSSNNEWLKAPARGMTAGAFLCTSRKCLKNAGFPRKS